MEELIKMTIISGPSVLLVATLIFFGKNMIEFFFSNTVEVKKSELSQQLENHKNKIEQQNKSYQHHLDEKIEEHRNRLEILKQEYQIQFSHIHTERATVIKQVYQNLIELQSAMFAYTRELQIIYENGEKEEQERIDRLNKAIHEFSNYFALNKLYLPKSICEKAAHLYSQYWDKGWDFGATKRSFKDGYISKDEYKEAIEKQRKISNDVKDEFPPLIEDISDEFRKILGIKE